MPVCKILEDYPNAEGWQKGDVVDITNPVALIAEGKVELYVAKEPVSDNGDNADSKTAGSKASKKKSK